MKHCKRCGLTKPVTEFNKRAANKDGLYSYCKLCSRAESRDAVRAWKKANPEKLREYTRESRAKSPHRDQVYAANSRAKRLGIPGVISVSEWEAVLSRAAGKCQACREEDQLTLDHVNPFAKGGPNTGDNIQALCLDCNQRKGANIEYYRQE